MAGKQNKIIPLSLIVVVEVKKEANWASFECTTCYEENCVTIINARVDSAKGELHLTVRRARIRSPNRCCTHLLLY